MHGNGSELGVCNGVSRSQDRRLVAARIRRRGCLRSARQVRSRYSVFTYVHRYSRSGIHGLFASRSSLFGNESTTPVLRMIVGWFISGIHRAEQQPRSPAANSRFCPSGARHRISSVAGPRRVVRTEIEIFGSHSGSSQESRQNMTSTFCTSQAGWNSSIRSQCCQRYTDARAPTSSLRCQMPLLTADDRASGGLVEDSSIL